ncbi:ABC transporter permease [Rhizobium sp. NTR19]|uniref:Transport permease protein n=1 Tax=Neorhizobium turbinariae TaxID=2937795 RepID=A0ABT0IRY8_9HYPH|nr:ABC transporter permease [Neorhizobium turbinariae]MCK8780579.1 ABC transporter permease [Neorhizobium turbinariae]
MYYLKAHLRVVSAFIIREMATRYGRSPGGYLWAFLEPIAFIAIMSVLMGALGRMPPKGDSFTLFYATGFIAFNMYKGMLGYVTSSVSANKNLMTFPTVAPIDAVVGRVILEGATSVVVATIILFAASFTARYPFSVEWSKIIEATALAWLLAMGVALANIVLFARFPLYQKTFDIVMRPLFLLSGVFFNVADMPAGARNILLWNPVAHVVILFRQGFYGDAGTDYVDVQFLAETSCTALMVGMMLFTFFSVARLQD